MAPILKTRRLMCRPRTAADTARAGAAPDNRVPSRWLPRPPRACSEADPRRCGRERMGGAIADADGFESSTGPQDHPGRCPRRQARGPVTEPVGAGLGGMMKRFRRGRPVPDHSEDSFASGRIMRTLADPKAGRREPGVTCARLEPAALVIYRLERDNLRVGR